MTLQAIACINKKELTLSVILCNDKYELNSTTLNLASWRGRHFSWTEWTQKTILLLSVEFAAKVKRLIFVPSVQVCSPYASALVRNFSCIGVNKRTQIIGKSWAFVATKLKEIVVIKRSKFLLICVICPLILTGIYGLRSGNSEFCEGLDHISSYFMSISSKTYQFPAIQLSFVRSEGCFSEKH